MLYLIDRLDDGIFSDRNMRWRDGDEFKNIQKLYNYLGIHGLMVSFRRPGTVSLSHTMCETIVVL